MLIAAGNPEKCVSCAGPALDDILARYQVVHVHQCLTAWGIFIAARARLAGALVIGSDLGGGDVPDLVAYPVIADVFDLFHALSDFATTAFLGLPVPCRVIAGPVDDSIFPLSLAPRDPAQLLSLGRILPHKGFERAIAALPEGARLTIVGHNYDDAYLAFLKERARGRDVVFRTEASDADLKEIMRSASLLLHTGVHIGYQGMYYGKPELLSLAPLEAMATGMPAIVSQAGALPELARLAGCRSFHDEAELTAMLRRHLAGELFTLAPAEIRAGVVAEYGLASFGRRYLHIIRDALADRR